MPPKQWVLALGGPAHQATSQGGALISLSGPCREHRFEPLTLAFGDPESTIRSVLQESS